MNDLLLFRGLDAVSGKNTELTIYKNKIDQVFHGYDNIYNVYQTRGFGLNWAPVRITYKDLDADKLIYIITGYNKPGTMNKDFYNFLVEWLS